MEARTICVLMTLTILFLVDNCVLAQRGFRSETKNFVVVAPDASLARRTGELAEKYRKQLSQDWLGYQIPEWSEKCPIRVQLGPHAGGETSFAFVDGAKREPVGWQMKIFGPADRLLDAVLPHEVTHTIFATHFGQPLPRWADEGACTTVEHASERQKNHHMLMDFLTTKPSRGIPFNKMFTMKNYPQDILPLYAQGYSVAKYLIAQKGRQHFVKYIEFGLANESRSSGTQVWDSATKRFYGYDNLSDLQVKWLSWVRDGSRTGMLAAPAAAEAKPQLNTPRVPPATYVADISARPLADAEQTLEHAGSWYMSQSRQSAKSLATAGPTPAPVPDAAQPAFRPGSVGRVPDGGAASTGNGTIWR